MASKISPNRRRSIAVLNTAQSSRHIGRRRAYSIAPGQKLSPNARRRRSLVPRKSILKASINLPENEGASALADETTTQSMDLTEVHQAQPRKSLARRVSFASHAHVRLFEIQENTNGSNEPPSSPADPSESARDENDENLHPQGQRRRSSMRRRSSTAFSEFGERSMDMDMDNTAPLPEAFLRNQTGYQVDGSAVEDDEFTDEDDDDDDMEVTEAIRLNIERKRSLSLGQALTSLPGRRRSSVAPVTVTQGQSENQPPLRSFQPYQDKEDDPSQEQDEDVTTSSANSQSFVSEGSSADNDTQHMEFTAPVGKSLRPASRPSAAWLALQAVTHAGIPQEESPSQGSDEETSGVYDGAEEGEPMELTDAMDRLLKARVSLGMPPVPEPSGSDIDDSAPREEFQDDSFTSTEDSFAEDAVGDRTVNVTTIIRSSLGTQDSMDAGSMLSGTNEDRPVRMPIGASPVVLPVPTAPVVASSPSEPAAPSPPSQAPAPTQSPAVSAPPLQSSVFTGAPRSSVFTPPPKTPAQAPRSPSKPPPSATIPKPFSFSLSRTPARPPILASTPNTAGPSSSSDTNAAAPRSPAVRRPSAAFAPLTARKSPIKRLAPPESEAAHSPSPAKRAAVGRLAPAKIAPYEKEAGGRRASMVRRPSGYFAQRKSLGAGVFPPAGPGTTSGAPSGRAKLSSPKKKAEGLGVGRARASVGATPSGTGSGLFVFGREGTSEDTTSGPLYPDISRIEEEDPPTPTRASSAPPESPIRSGREAVQLANAAPSPTRGSPSPASPRTGSPGHSIIQPLRLDSPNVRPLVRSRSASPAPSPRVASPALAPLSTETTFKDTGISLTRPAGLGEPVDSAVTEQWREGVEGNEAGYDDEGPSISIEQFFDMTGIRFMDELTMPKPRQSVVAPPQLRSCSRRPSSEEFTSEPDEDPIPLTEFAIAMAVELPRMDLFTAVANDLSAWIEESKKICVEAERETEKVTPELFRDFVAADESEKGLLIHQLKLIKANNYGTAKSQWYDWKMDWTQRLYARARQEFANLESDAQVLATIIKQAQATLPDLREEYALVMAELEQERADITEIENSDQEYLNELKATIAEQSSELDVFRTDVSEGRAKLDRLQEKLAEIEEQKREAAIAIAEAQHIVHIQKESTSSAVFSLKDELEALEDLHLWRVTKVAPDLIELVYALRYEVSIPCLKYRPIPAEAVVGKAKNLRTRERDAFPRLTDLAVRVAQHMLVESKGTVSVRQIVERLGDFWCACSQLRSQLTFLAIKFPLSVEITSGGETVLPNLVAKATIMFSGARGKATVVFICNSETYTSWPMSITCLKADVQVHYGHIQKQTILDAVLGRLSQATPTDSHGCLLDACIEAIEQHE